MKTFLIGLIIVVLAGGVGYGISQSVNKGERNVDFEEFGEGFELEESGENIGSSTETVEGEVACPGIFIATPAEGTEVTFPLQVSGTIHPEGTQSGEWAVFEGVAGSMVIKDQNGNIHSERVRIDVSDWMNLNQKPFSVTIPELTSQPYSTSIHLVINDGNVADSEESSSEPCVIPLNMNSEAYLDMSSTTPDRMSILVPLVAAADDFDAPGVFGCGSKIEFSQYEAPMSPAVLTAVYNKLFELPGTIVPGQDSPRNTVGYLSQLEFERVDIVNGVASLYLTGSFIGPGHCADPEIPEQLKEAAFQYDTVDELRVYLDNELVDGCWFSDAEPEESGCDTTPRPWIFTK